MKGNDVLFVVFFIGIGIAALLSGGAKSSGTQNKVPVFSSGSSANGSSVNRNPTTNKPVTEKTIAQEIKKIERSVEEIAKEITKLEENQNASTYKGSISMRISGRASSDPIKEYITLEASSKNKEPINITGWQLKSLSTNKNVSIKQGVYLFFPQSQNPESDIYLNPNDKAYISTGRSPMGISFKVNACSGYHSQFLSFTPSIRQECPLARDEVNKIPTSPVNDSCFDFIDRFPKCRTEVNSLPSNFTFECRNFILEKMTYSSCINTHKNDADFYKKEWRVYLGRDESLWKQKRETIVLLDNLGKTVALVTFR